MELFDQIVDEYSRKVFSHAMHFLGNKQDAEDATQEVFLRIHKALGNFRGDSSISTWIFRITYNVCMTARSMRATRKCAELPDEGSMQSADPSADPEEQLMSADLSTHLTQAIAQLSPHERASIVLFYMGEKSYDEIAEILSIPKGTVATALHRGRERLRKHLQDELTEDIA